MGDTGSGKSTLLTQILQQIADRGEIAIVYDTAGEFTERFYKKSRDDWILNPLDARTPYWTPSSELRNPAEARTIATSMYQPRDDKRGEFFTETPQKIFAHLLKYRPSPEELVEWMSNEEEIDRASKVRSWRTSCTDGRASAAARCAGFPWADRRRAAPVADVGGGGRPTVERHGVGREARGLDLPHVHQSHTRGVASLAVAVD